MKKIKHSDILLIILLAIAVWLEIFKINFFPNDALLNNIVYMIISRIVASLFFIILIIQNKIKLFSYKNPKNFLLIIPCLLIVICNMPLIELIEGKCKIEASPILLFLFTIECIAVALFEELAFRGLLLPIALKKYAKSKLSIFFCIIVTSLIFGCYHILNLFAGAGIGPTMLQICYSALVGAMCGAAYLITGNILCPIILHAGYNFAGTLVDTLGYGEQWNIRRVIIFAIVSIIVILYMIAIFVKSEKFELIENNK